MLRCSEKVGRFAKGRAGPAASPRMSLAAERTCRKLPSRSDPTIARQATGGMTPGAGHADGGTLHAPGSLPCLSEIWEGYLMDTSTMMAALVFGTLVAIVVFAVVSQRKSAERRRSKTQKSTLASNAPKTTPPGTKPVDT